MQDGENVADRPNWYGGHPPACTCVSCTRGRFTNRKPYPSRKPRRGYRWELCSTCNGTGQVIGRQHLQTGGKITRCPRCFRVGWVETPIQPTPKKPVERENKPSEKASHPPDSILDRLEKLLAEEKPPASHTGGKSERDIHGANCDCKACVSLRKRYAEARPKRRVPIWTRPSDSAQSPPTGGRYQQTSLPEPPWKDRSVNGWWIALIMLLIGGAAVAFSLGAFDGFFSGDDESTSAYGHSPTPTRSTPVATAHSTPTPTEWSYSNYVAGMDGSNAPAPTRSTPTATPILTLMPTQRPTATPRPTLVIPVSLYTPSPIPTPTRYTPISLPTPVPTPTLPPTVAPAPTPEPTPVAPNLRHVDEKWYMLELINAERTDAGLVPVVLGDNDAAQLHAESALDNCFSSHWGIDGQKPYMRYSLAGGYQSNAENVLGSSYCIKASDGYRTMNTIEEEIRDAMDSWMNSPGHRRNILRTWHWKVNIGLAWDKYNFLVVQHFEGDHVEYSSLPNIRDGILSIEGTMKNGVTFNKDQDLSVQIYYDPPPRSLTRGQLSRTYCYTYGRPIASLRPPLRGNSFYSEDVFVKLYESCRDPYEFPSEAPAPRSHDEARRFWQEAYAASQASEPISVTVPWITASEWTASGDIFSVRADIGHLLDKYGDGVYSLVVWASLGGENIIISEYSLFLGGN